MCDERTNHARRRLLLTMVVALLLAGCGPVQIFDSFGEDEPTVPATPDEQRTTSGLVDPAGGRPRQDATKRDHDDR